MIKGKFQPAVIAAMLLAASNANATLEPRLNGHAYYDTETDLSWTTSINPFGWQTINEHLTSLMHFIPDGINGWQIPTYPEIWHLVHNNFDCSMIVYCDLDTVFDPAGAGDWTFTFEPQAIPGNTYYVPGSDGRYYGAYAPLYNEPYPTSLDGYNGFVFALWPMHTGDVGLLSPVPEPATYALLLAGLGLLGFMAHRRKESAV